MPTETETPRWLKWFDTIVLTPLFTLLPLAAVLALLLRLGGGCGLPTPPGLFTRWLPLGWLALVFAAGVFVSKKHPQRYPYLSPSWSIKMYDVHYPAALLRINVVTVCLALVAAGLFTPC